jgi:hypothetical protein
MKKAMQLKTCKRLSGISSGKLNGEPEMNPKVKAQILLAYADALMTFAVERLNKYHRQADVIREIRQEHGKKLYPNQHAYIVKRFKNIDFDLEKELAKDELPLSVYIYLIVDLLAGAIGHMADETAKNRLTNTMTVLIGYRENYLSTEAIGRAESISDKIMSVLGIKEASHDT